MSRIETYCQEEFLIHFFKNYIEDFDDERHEIFNKLYHLLNKKADIIIDSDNYLLANRNIPRINKLIKSSTSGGCKIINYKQYFEQIKEDSLIVLNSNPTSVHFFKNKIFEDDENYGVFIADSCNFINSTEKISSINTYKIHPETKFNEFNGWASLKPILPKRNALIIADNYFLKNESRYPRNLYDLLKLMLPNSLENQDYHLSIITQKETLNIEKKYKKIKNFIDSLEKPYNVKFGIYLPNRHKPHDRVIISNYFQIEVGHSFELYNEHGNIIKDTKLSLYTINSEAISVPSYFNVISSLVNYTKDATCIGDSNNRLIEQFK